MQKPVRIGMYWYEDTADQASNSMFIFDLTGTTEHCHHRRTLQDLLAETSLNIWPSNDATVLRYYKAAQSDRDVWAGDELEYNNIHNQEDMSSINPKP